MEIQKSRFESVLKTLEGKIIIGEDQSVGVECKREKQKKLQEIGRKKRVR